MPRRDIVADAIPPPLFHEPHAVKAGPYLFISGQMAADGNGVVPAAPPEPEAPVVRLAGEARGGARARQP